MNLMDSVRSFVWRQPLTLLMAFAWVGIAIERFSTVSESVWFGLAGAAAIGLFAVHGWRYRVPGGCRIGLICVMVLGLFALRHQHVLEDYESASVLSVIGENAQPMVLVGRVDRPARLQRDPLESDNGIDGDQEWGNAQVRRQAYQTILQVRIESLRVGLQQEPFTGRALVRIDGDCATWLPGDRVQLLGQISRFLGPTNPGERDFRKWAARNDLHCKLHVDSPDEVTRPVAEALADGSGAADGFTLWQRGQRIIARLAASARGSVLEQIASEQQGLALALILGQRDLLDRSTSESLLVTGTAHLLSVSGLHLGILLVLARMVGGLLRLPLRGQLVFLAIVALFYVAITGGRPPVLRAAILLGTVVLSTALARPQHSINSLSFAGLLLAWWSPAAVFSVGMQLSFLAVATLLLCGRPGGRGRTAASQTVELEDQFDQLARQSRGRWQRRFRFVVRSLGTALWYSLCVSAVTLPIVWEQFHVVSPISVLVNVMLSPMMVVALSAGVATVIAGWIFAPLAIIPGWICSQMLWLMNGVIEMAVSVPGGHVWLPCPSMVWIVAYYVVVVGIITVRSAGRRRRPMVVWSSVWFVAAWWMATTPSPLPEATYEATFVDVGHGTATVLRRDRDEVWLYDCGWMGNRNFTSRKIEDVLWSMGVTRIEGIVLSHADADHFNALPGLAKRFSIGCVVTPPGMLDGEGATLDRTRRVIARDGIPVLEMDRDRSVGRVFLPASVPDWWNEIHVLHPPSTRIDANDNANSLVLRIDHGGRCLLLPGDLEPPGTSVLISTPRPRAGGVMMAPHHGSLRMDAGAVLQWARPRETVVSGGKRAAQPAVTEMLSAAGGGVHVTAKEGAIRVRIGPDGEIEIRSWANSAW